MTGPKITLRIDASSTEGINDFIKVLDLIVGDIKAGDESGIVNVCDEEGAPARSTAYWKIQTHPEERDESTVAVFPLRTPKGNATEAEDVAMGHEDPRDVADRRYPEAGV